MSAPRPGDAVAVVGAGIAGLTAASLLHKQYDVTVYEAGAFPGGHSNTIDVEDPRGVTPVDTGFIVYNERNYPLFTKLLAQLGVVTRPSDMSFSVRDGATGLEYNGTSLSALFAQRRNALSPGFLVMLRDILRFNRSAERVLREAPDTRTVAEHVAAERYSRRFVEHYLVPIGASLWSSPADDFRDFPIRFVVEFLHAHGMLQLRGRPQWRTVAGGAREYVKKLTAPFAGRIRLGCPVRSIRRSEEAVRITTAAGESARHDHAVVACHADQALRLLENPTPAERDVLAAFPSQRNRTLLHTDASVLPRSPRAVAAWNYHRAANSPNAATLTYNMNMLQSLDTERTYLVTLGDDGSVDPACVVREIEYRHPRFAPGRLAAQARSPELVSAGRLSFCGAYWGYGFHEDGVRSAVRVAEAFGVRWP